MQNPIKDFSIEKNVSQLFGEDYNYYKYNYGIPGHNGLDIVVHDSNHGYGEPILATHNGTVERIGYDVPHRTCGNYIYLLDESKKFTTVYLHLAGFQCNVGDTITKGQVIGLMGNSGTTVPAPTSYDPKLGTHLHFAIKFHDKVNQYGGYVNPLPFLWDTSKFPVRYKFRRHLWLNNSGDDVVLLQNILSITTTGKTLDYECYGFFGNRTRKDVQEYQTKFSISPILGYCGSKTQSDMGKFLGR